MYDGPQRKRLRAPGFDYRDPGPYAVTICSQHRVCRFGTVAEGRVTLTPAGDMVEAIWRDLATRFPGTVLDAMVLMPNHLHAVLTLAIPERPDLDGLPSLSDVIAWFKTMTTRRYVHGVRSDGWPSFDGRLWQQGFYDHIVRNEAEMERQRTYIAQNPARWSEDPYHL